MTIREEMRSLTEEIVGSYADRIATITELRETVKLDLREVRTHLEELRDSRVAGAKEVRADLARDAANRKHEVGDMLNGFGQALAAMGKEMRADLAKGVANRQREVGDMLNGFGQALATMGKETRADLAKGIANRQRDVGALLRGFSAELNDIRSELAGARDEWQKLTATMPSKRGGIAVAVKPLIEETTPETAALREQAFEYLANHPDGTKMAELEKVFGLARIQMAKIIRNLMDENKVEKQALLYFAV